MTEKSVSLSFLPRDVLITIFEYCDMMSLVSLARTCKTFRNIIKNEDTVWRRTSRYVYGSNMASQNMLKRCKPILSYKERCKVSKRWLVGLSESSEVLCYTKCKPWSVIEKDNVYLSNGKALLQFKRANNGNISSENYKKLIPCEGDIVKFAVNEEEIVCGGRYGRLTRVNKFNMCIKHSVMGHEADILAVDTKNNIIVSGSQDYSLKIWESLPTDTQCKSIIEIGNRVASTSILPSNNLVVVGTPGTRSTNPLQIFDLERGVCLTVCGNIYEGVAGTLDIFAESCNTFYSTGYDSLLKLWDIRCAEHSSVYLWVEPFKSNMYCVQSDHNFTILTGTCYNGSFCLWDKRYPHKPITRRYVPVKEKYKGDYELHKNENRKSAYHYKYINREPVYSLAFDAAHIFIAYEKCFIQSSYM